MRNICCCCFAVLGPKSHYHQIKSLIVVEVDFSCARGILISPDRTLLSCNLVVSNLIHSSLQCASADEMVLILIGARNALIAEAKKIKSKSKIFRLISE